MQTINIPITQIDGNEGQVEGLPKNPRFIRDEKFEALKRSIEEDPEMLQLREVMVYPYNGKYVAIGGNMRLAALKELGYTEVPCKVIPEDTDVQKLRAYTMKDNYGYGEWDMQILSDEWDLTELDDWGMDDIVTFDIGEDEIEQIPNNDDNFDEEKAKKRDVFVESGDIWLLGNHRLMCGNSMDSGRVALLLDGNKADISFTSPPYGASNSDNLRNHCVAGHSHDRQKFYDKHEDDIDEWPELIQKTYENMAQFSVMQFINIQMLADNKRKLTEWQYNNVEKLVDIIIWDKKVCAPQMNANVLNNRFEFIFVFGGEGNRKITYGDFHGNVSNVIDDVSKEQNKFADVHKAVFPLALPMKILEINKKAKSVLDLFGGTGTTLIAAERMGIKSYMMELSEQYASIIIDRFISEVNSSESVYLLRDGYKIPYSQVIKERL